MTTTETCTHAWIIELAKGPTSWGTCRLCHETKQFRNSITVKEYNLHPDRVSRAATEMTEARKRHDLDRIGYPWS